MRVPEEISVIGIDNHELSEYFDLSTIAQPAPELGALGARTLLDALTLRRSRAAPGDDRPDAAHRPGHDGTPYLPKPSLSPLTSWRRPSV